MRMSDLMGGMDLATFPQIAMLLFLAVFAVVVFRTFGRRTRANDESRWAGIPLDEPSCDAPAPSAASAARIHLQENRS